MVDLLLLWILTITFFSHPLSLCWIFSLYKPRLEFQCYSMFQNSHWWCAAVEQWNQRNFFYHRLCHLVPITPLHQSSQGPGYPGRSVVLSTDTQPPSSFPTSSPLIVPQQQFLMGIIICVSPYERRKRNLHCSFSHSPLLNFIYSASTVIVYLLFLLLCSHSLFVHTHSLQIKSSFTGTHPSKLQFLCVPSFFPSSSIFLPHLTFVQPLISDWVLKFS